MVIGHRFARLFVLGLLAAGILAGCMGDDDEDPTQTPVVVTPTPAGDDSGETEPTSTLPSTPTIETLPTATPAPTTAPTETPAPTTAPTAQATQQVTPTATLPTGGGNATPAPQPTAGNGSTGGVDVPDDLLSILPTVDDAPPGMVVVDEGPADIEIVAADFEDEAARQQQLVDWGFQGAALREFELPEEQIVDQASQPLGLINRVILLGSADAAQAEMNSFTDEIVLNAPDVTTEEIQIDPLGDAHRAIVATGGEGEEAINVVFLSMTAGPLSFQFIAGGGAQYDPLPDAITAAQATLARLGYQAGGPIIGDVLLETDFSNWIEDEFDSGVIFYGDDDLYHVVVEQGDGAFISAYSTDHEPFTDFAVSVDMLMVSGAPAAQGCVQARVDSISQQYDYTLCVDGNGNVEALYEEFGADGSYNPVPLVPGGLVTVAPPFDWTTLTIAARGQEFWFLINGELIDSVTHTGPPGGAVGVLVNNYGTNDDAPAEFVFTNLVVQEVQ